MQIGRRKLWVVDITTSCNDCSTQAIKTLIPPLLTVESASPESTLAGPAEVPESTPSASPVANTPAALAPGAS